MRHALDLVAQLSREVISIDRRKASYPESPRNEVYSSDAWLEARSLSGWWRSRCCEPESCRSLPRDFLTYPFDASGAQRSWLTYPGVLGCCSQPELSLVRILPLWRPLWTPSIYENSAQRQPSSPIIFALTCLFPLGRDCNLLCYRQRTRRSAHWYLWHDRFLPHLSRDPNHILRINPQ